MRARRIARFRPDRIALSAALVLRITSPLSAQTPATAVPVAQCAVDDPTVLADLTSAYDAGDTGRFGKAVTLLMEFVHRCAAAPVEGPDRAFLKTIDLASDYMLLAWPGMGTSAERRLYTAIVHLGDALNGHTLAGVGLSQRARLIEVLLAPSMLDRLASVYVSEPEPNPSAGQLPLVAAAIAGPLLSALAAQQGTIAGPQQGIQASGTVASGPSAWASVSRVDLPFRRSRIHVELRARVAPTVTEVQHQALAIGNRTAFLDVPHQPCARALAAEFTAILTILAKTCADRPEACMDAADLQFTSRYDAQQLLCPGATAADTRRNLQALEQVDGAFRQYVSGLGRTLLPATVELSNAPKSRYAFGIAGGYLSLARTRAARARIANGVISADPLPRQVSMVVVNGAFRAYDGTRARAGWSERIRWFAGTVIAPDIGAGAGLSILAVRGLAFNVGAAVVVIRAPARGERFGTPPVNTVDPFRAAAVRGGFVGLSYNFK